MKEGKTDWVPHPWTRLSVGCSVRKVVQFPRKLCSEISQYKYIGHTGFVEDIHIWAIYHTTNSMNNIWIRSCRDTSSLAWQSSFYRLIQTLEVDSKLKLFLLITLMNSKGRPLHLLYLASKCSIPRQYSLPRSQNSPSWVLEEVLVCCHPGPRDFPGLISLEKALPISSKVL